MRISDERAGQLRDCAHVYETDELQAAVRDLAADLLDAREALRPFAATLEAVDRQGMVEDSNIAIIVGQGEQTRIVTWGDIRRAARALPTPSDAPRT